MTPDAEVPARAIAADSCSFLCGSPRSWAVFIGLVLSLPTVMVSFACGTGVMAVAARVRMRSGVIAGTIAACVGLLAERS